MESGVKTARQLAEELYAVMPHAVSTDTLNDYGITASAEARRHLTLEALYLSVVWIESALGTLLTPGERERVQAELHRRVAEGWRADFHLEKEGLDGYATELAERRRVYARMIGGGGTPVDVFGEAASLMELNQMVSAEDRMKVLALFLDLIPVDAFGDLLEDVELTDA